MVKTITIKEIEILEKIKGSVKFRAKRKMISEVYAKRGTARF